jgi:hypothetical protein
MIGFEPDDGDDQMTHGVQRRLEDLCTLRDKYGAGIQRTGVNYAAYCNQRFP